MSAVVQGFLATISIDTQDITAMVEALSVGETKSVLEKPTMDGSPFSKTIPGNVTGTLSLNGDIDQENLNKLEASWLKDTEVAFVVSVTEGAGTDAVWTGSLVLGDFTRETSGDSKWTFTLSGTSSGQTVYTPYVA